MKFGMYSPNSCLYTVMQIIKTTEMILPKVLSGILTACTSLAATVHAAVEMPSEPPPSIRESFGLAPFYQQWIDVEGFPVVASEKVNPRAITEAAWLIRNMIGHRPDILQALAENNVRFSIMAYNEMTTEIPEHSDLRPDFYWDRRARGLGATAARPSTSCGEENLLNYPGDPYTTENILIHEFSHAIHQMGLSTVDPDFDNRLRELYASAMEKGLWKGTYASTNKEEYWAEGAQSWFNANRENDSQHNHVSTRELLKDYDPEFATLLTDIFGDTDWRYTLTTTRSDLPHLQGYTPKDAPTFKWPPGLAACYKQLQSPDGDGGDKWVDLKRHEPTQLSALTSSNDGGNTAILFVNNSAAEITYYWVDAEGKESYRGRAAAEAYSIQHTHAGHIWLVKDQNDENLAVFQAVEKTGRAFIGK